LRIGIFMDQLTFVHEIRSVLHIDAVGKQPEFAVAYAIVVEVGAGHAFRF
jgi:hypothetical protein